MSLTTKDMVFGGATAAAFLGLIVYNEAKFKKMQEEIDRLSHETKTLAQYVKLLETQMHSEIHGGQRQHHHHQVGAANTPGIQGSSPNPQLPGQRVDAINAPSNVPPNTGHQEHHHNHGSHHRHNHQEHHASHHNPPATQQRSAPPPPQQDRFVRRTPSQPHAREEPAEEDSGDGEESPQNSSRRPSRAVPRNAAPRSDNRAQSQPRGQPSRPMVERSAARPQERSKPSQQHRQQVEKEKEEADDHSNANAASSQRRVRVSAPKQEEPEPSDVPTAPKKKFAGKTDDDEPTEKMISSRRPGKSILKKPNGNNNNNANTEGEGDIDADIMNDIEAVATSGGRKDSSKQDNEGRPAAESDHKVRAAKTAQRAEAMRKQAEERKAARAAAQGP